jgi:hypothetical protein
LLKGLWATDNENGAPQKETLWGILGVWSPKASKRGSSSDSETEGGEGMWYPLTSLISGPQGEPTNSPTFLERVSLGGKLVGLSGVDSQIK